MEYTDEKVEEIVQEAVLKTEKSFGGTFKRLKSENEELEKKYEIALSELDAAKTSMGGKITELEALAAENVRQISELAVKSEVQKQLRTLGPIPEQFIDTGKIEFSENPEILSANVAKALDESRIRLERTLQENGIQTNESDKPRPNPTNPPSRDTKTARDLKSAETKEALKDMMKRGLLR